jgi:hypothetical protein
VEIPGTNEPSIRQSRQRGGQRCHRDGDHQGGATIKAQDIVMNKETRAMASWHSRPRHRPVVAERWISPMERDQWIAARRAISAAARHAAGAGVDGDDDHRQPEQAGISIHG